VESNSLCLRGRIESRQVHSRFLDVKVPHHALVGPTIGRIDYTWIVLSEYAALALLCKGLERLLPLRFRRTRRAPRRQHFIFSVSSLDTVTRFSTMGFEL
jgi:hypothetical protein